MKIKNHLRCLEHALELNMFAGSKTHSRYRIKMTAGVNINLHIAEQTQCSRTNQLAEIKGLTDYNPSPTTLITHHHPNAEKRFQRTVDGKQERILYSPRC